MTGALGIGVGIPWSQNLGPPVNFDFGAGMPAGIVTTRGSLATQYDATTKLSRWVDHNYCPRSDDLDNAAWSKRGAVTVTTGQTDPWGGTTACRINNLGALGVDDIYDSWSTAITGTPLSNSLWVHKNGGSGVMRMQHTVGGPTKGIYYIDLDALADEWVRVTRDHAAVTVTTEFEASSGGGLWFYMASGSASPLIIRCQQFEGTRDPGDLDETEGSQALAEPRRGTDAEGTGDVGLQQEPASTNTYTNSNVFSGWPVKLNITVTPDSTVAPTGETEGVKIEATATASCNHQYTWTAGDTEVALSVFLKEGINSGTEFLLRNNTTATTLVRITVTDWDTGAFTLTVSTHGTATLVPVGNGWLRLSFHATSGVTGGDTLRLNLAYTGNPATAGDHLFAYGMQIEDGPPTSYIPTGSSPETRLIETHTYTPAAGVIVDANGTMYVECSVSAPLEAGVFRAFVELNDGSDGDRHSMFVSNTAGGDDYAEYSVSSAGGAQANVTNLTNTITAATRHKASLAWKEGVQPGTPDAGINLSLDGTSGTLDTDCQSLPICDRFMFGGNSVPAASLRGFIYTFKYWNIHKTPPEQDILTT